ncbi:41283_t:CDS:2 [Gigaspora margarita]|uniref:41283_t:CDS:1 n=1 Tax=Gigaspora margarita TaxID=4874 RepID=A0ABM8VYV7_GIGMA|nr:41283_t:CDS:2 [Gigaspora margarita]
MSLEDIYAKANESCDREPEDLRTLDEESTNGGSGSMLNTNFEPILITKTPSANYNYLIENLTISKSNRWYSRPHTNQDNSGTPQEYVDLNTNCWFSEPEKRPKLDNILNNLDKLSTEALNL